MKALRLIIQVILIIVLPLTSFAQWTQVVSGTTQKLRDVHFPTTNVGYAVGDSGTILKTIDAGNTWITLKTGQPFRLNAVTFLDANIGFVVGDSVWPLKGMFLKTTDGGNTWGQVNASKSKPLNDIKFINNQIGFCVGGNGSILKTINGGLTWSLTIIPPNIDQGGFTSICFPTPNIGYAVRTGYTDYLVKTTDGGNTWNVVQLNSNSYASNTESVFFTDANTGYIGGWYFSRFIKTTDGGNNWLNCNVTTSLSVAPIVYSIYFPSANIGYAVGAGIYKTSDGGSTWEKQNEHPSSGESIYFTSNTDGYIVGANGTILKTNNGGSVIGIEENSNENIELNIFPNPTNGIINVELEIRNGVLGIPTSNNQVEIINMLGEVVMEEPAATNHLTIDTSNLTTGIYLLKLISSNNIITTQKIIKE